MGAVSPTSRRPPKPKPVKPWQRAEAGRYRSADARFMLESDGGGRWFITDEQERDELGLARTTGPFATLDAAKTAVATARERPAAPSPLASRIAGAAGRPRREPAATPRAAPNPETTPVAPGARPGDTTPARPRQTWLEEFAERDAAAAKRATRLIATLEREGIVDADALVRRDILGDRPAVATRLLARDILAAIAALADPTPLSIADAVAGVLGTSPASAGLPGWDLVERDASGARGRPIRLTGADLAAAARSE